jgi:hypothetical protein
MGALRFLTAQGLMPVTTAPVVAPAPRAAPVAPPRVDDTTDDDDDAPTGGGLTQDMLLADTGIALE